MDDSKLFPPIEPYHQGFLKVSSIHEIYFEEVGNPNGRPIVFLHGGPGGGISPHFRQYFDPTKWRVILFDQRGCGKSQPFAELQENTTWDLVADIEKLREHLHIERWSVFGGSWGSTLALAYGVTHPQRVESFFLRGIFLLRKKEIDWFYQEGCSRIFPDLFSAYQNPIPETERHDMVKAYHQRLTSADSNIRKEFAKYWSVWEGATSKLVLDPESLKRFSEDEFAEAFARIECHYFINRGFFSEDNFLLNKAPILKNHPMIIVQGRYDVVCPFESAWDLHQTLPHSKLLIASDSGHSLSEIGITKLLIESLNRY